MSKKRSIQEISLSAIEQYVKFTAKTIALEVSTMDKARVSVIVPVYKIDETLLTQCLTSLTAQTETSAEFIIIDDGSPDNCGQIIDEFATKDARIVAIHTLNGGVSVARNIGIEKASGEFILFVDGDDYIEPVMCEKVIDAMEKSKTDILFFKHTSSNTKKNLPSGDESISILPSDQFKSIRFDIVSQRESFDNICFGSPWGKVFKRSIIEKNNLQYVAGLKKSQDRVFVYDYLSQATSGAIYNFIGYHYVSNAGSVCHRFNDGIAQTLSAVAHEFEERKLLLDKSEAAQFDNALDSMYMTFLYECIRLYIFHPDNPQRYQNKIKELKYLLSLNEYAHAIKHGDLNLLNGKRKKLVIILVRYHIYWPIGIIIAY